ncbi:MAG: hypothetical protein QNJ65_23755 [Xenococcaceae cyanobacterium MO_234.B1]|nr:hypothetical protein [Xenococcaceae cyanobacterium MO_234.B1]
MPQTVEELKTKKQNQLLLLQKELESATRQESKKSFSKQIELTEKLLEQIAAYENINEGDFVCNGNSEKFGKVFNKELQNSLPVIWVDWDGVQISHASVSCPRRG